MLAEAAGTYETANFYQSLHDPITKESAVFSLFVFDKMCQLPMSVSSSVFHINKHCLLFIKSALAYGHTHTRVPHTGSSVVFNHAVVFMSLL